MSYIVAFVCLQEIEKDTIRSRSKVFKEIEIFHVCRGQDSILQMHEYFEEEDHFYLVFEKIPGGTLLANIEQRGHLNELEASQVVKCIASALDFLHSKGAYLNTVTCVVCDWCFC